MPLRRMFYIIAACFLTGCLLKPAVADPGDSEAITVFAAARLGEVHEKLAADRKAQSGESVRVSTAASSTVARHIGQARSPTSSLRPKASGWTTLPPQHDRSDTRVTPIGNELVLIAPADSALSSVRIDANFDIARLIGRAERLATGDPDHVPVGIYARAAFEHRGV